MEKKEAMKILKDFYDKSALFSVRTALDTVLPELKESEDEKIRKWLIAQLELKSDVNNSRELELMILKSIAWLEKQGEKLQGKSALEAIKEEKVDNQNCVKPTEKKEPKFREGDNIQFKSHGHNRYTIKEVCGLSHYVNTMGNRMGMSYTDANFNLVEQNLEWSEDDEDAIGQAIVALEDMFDEDHPQNCYAGYKLSFIDAAERLKSLKDRVQLQNSWKPSDEQILALRWILNNIPYDRHKEEISGLLEQLKKLREK